MVQVLSKSIGPFFNKSNYINFFSGFLILRSDYTGKACIHCKLCIQQFDDRQCALASGAITDCVKKMMNNRVTLNKLLDSVPVTGKSK